jgi:periplasmic divalent cation tolerance protein
LSEYIIVLITVSGEEEAANIATELVNAGLAACANIIRGVRSIYRWEGKTEDGSEVLMIVKTRSDLFEGLAAKVRQLHSYSVPEIIAVPVIKGLEDYLDWIKSETVEQP